MKEQHCSSHCCLWFCKTKYFTHRKKNYQQFSLFCKANQVQCNMKRSYGDEENNWGHSFYWQKSSPNNLDADWNLSGAWRCNLELCMR